MSVPAIDTKVQSHVDRKCRNFADSLVVEAAFFDVLKEACHFGRPLSSVVWVARDMGSKWQANNGTFSNADMRKLHKFCRVKNAKGQAYACPLKMISRIGS